MTTPTSKRLAALGLIVGLAACDSDSGPLVDVATVEITGAPTAAAAGAEVSGLALVARDDAGAPVDGARLKLTVAAGGGRVGASVVATGADGVAHPAWILGLAPVDNRLTVEVGAATASVTVRAEVAAEIAPEPFGDVDAWLTAEGLEGSTEDLAFAPDGGLVIGIPGGLARVGVDGQPSPLALTGDPIDRPLGVTYAADGAAWVCDSGAGALLRVTPEGAVSTVVTNDGADDLITPNDVAIGPDGDVYFSDSCLGRVYRIDPATGAIRDQVDFDLPTEGGPNGLAFDAAGDLWLTTENTALLCGHSDVVITEAVAGLYRLTPTADGLGPATAVATGVGLFGDGLAFDAEGNLFAIFDTVKDVALDESIVYVLPAGDAELVRFFAVKGQVLANLAFGRGAYGDTTLYASLLAVPPFSTARGVVRVDVGLTGSAALP